MKFSYQCQGSHFHMKRLLFTNIKNIEPTSPFVDTLIFCVYIEFHQLGWSQHNAPKRSAQVKSYHMCKGDHGYSNPKKIKSTQGLR